jgi:hypothetical protein
MGKENFRNTDNERENESGGLPKKFILTGIILLLILLLLAGISVVLTVKLSRKLKNRDIQDTPANVVLDDRSTETGSKTSTADLSSRMIYFPGMEDATVTDDTIVKLENPSENEDIYLKYDVYDSDTGDLLFSTGLIPSGSYIGWTPGETMEPGEYHIVLNETPYIMLEGDTDYTQLTQGNNEFNLTLK